MGQIKTRIATPGAVQLKFARLSSAIAAFPQSNVYAMKPVPCPLPPIFGHVDPIKDRHGMVTGKCLSHRAGGTSSTSSGKSCVPDKLAALSGATTRAKTDLNGLFANSMNSLSVGMVNFSCCVCCPPHVTREVTAQPTRSAVRMETGIHAGV